MWYQCSYGTILLDPSLNHLLLKRQRNNYGGVTWTFPKGHQERDEFPRLTAMRETYEETGIVCRPGIPLAGSFWGTTTVSKYFFAIVDRIPRNRFVWNLPIVGSKIMPETSALQWTTWDGAKALIMQSRNGISRRRDLAVLRRARMQLPRVYNQRPT